VELIKEFATRSSYVRLAPKHRWQLLSTHGFYSRPDFRRNEASEKAIGGLLREPGEEPDLVLPGLNSGLWFAGANHRGGDAALTAAAVGELDLRGVELVILSACGTGLGELVNGEGAFGLQRAYHQAGTQTVVASWWEVNDRATRMLMTEFARRIWQQGAGRVSRLEALHKAQLSMIENYRPTDEELKALGEWGRGPATAPGKPIPQSNGPLSTAPSGSLSPFFWSGFVLSGDWR
jgi:CHAT domain-containing protein